MNTLSRRRFLQAAAGAAIAPMATRLLAQEASRGPFGVPDLWRWRLHIGGEVAHACLCDLQDALLLPSRLCRVGLFAQDGGSLSVAHWEGIHVTTFMRMAEPAPDAQYVHVTCADGHRDCHTLADLLRPSALFATTRDHWMLTPEQGGPLRLIVPWRLSARSPVAIERIEFQREPLPDVDLLRGLLAAADEGWFTPPLESLSAAEALAIEVTSQPPGPPVPQPWGSIRNPPTVPEPGRAEGYAHNLTDPSFILANGSRTSLAILGALDAIDPARPDSPLTSSLLEARIYAQDILAAADGERSTAWATARLSDPSPLVQAIALETVARRRAPPALPAALDCLTHPDPGLAQTAIVAVGALATRGDAGVLARLEGALGAAPDATRTALLHRALGSVAPQ